MTNAQAIFAHEVEDVAVDLLQATDGIATESMMLLVVTLFREHTLQECYLVDNMSGKQNANATVYLVAGEKHTHRGAQQSVDRRSNDFADTSCQGKALCHVVDADIPRLRQALRSDDRLGERRQTGDAGKCEQSCSDIFVDVCHDRSRGFQRSGLVFVAESNILVAHCVRLCLPSDVQTCYGQDAVHQEPVLDCFPGHKLAPDILGLWTASECCVACPPAVVVHELEILDPVWAVE